MTQKHDYAQEMFNNIASLIEETGKDDKNYDPKDKLLNIFDVLESLLAFSIYTACANENDIEACTKESAQNIKVKAIQMLKDFPPEPPQES